MELCLNFKSKNVAYLKLILIFLINSDAVKQANMRPSRQFISPKIDRSHEAELDKTQFKFNRKQNPGKQTGRKYKASNIDDRNFCYMSPGKISMMLSSRNSSVTAALSPASSPYLGSPLHDGQSFIQKLEDGNESCRMNDSLLSIYNQLDMDGKIKQQVKYLNEEVNKLMNVIEEYKQAQVRYQSRLKEAESLQQFLVQRQAYICQIHEENIGLLEKNNKTSKEKQLLLKENQYLRKLLQRQKDTHQQDIKRYQKQCQSYKQEYENIKQLYYKLQQDFKRDISDNMLNHSNEQENSLFENEYNEANDSSFIEGSFHLISLPKMNSPREPSQHRKSYKQLLSSRSGKNYNKYDQDDDSISRHRQCHRGCGCGSIIQSLTQKLRYNDIQIDILKRVKAKGESYRQQNDKLKKQNVHLSNRIDILKERKKRRKDSDQILQFSLSPLKSKSKSKKW